jgi:hypothetical protein
MDFFVRIPSEKGSVCMSLKAIEMQVALPRTQDAGKIQEQLQQRGQLSQDFASLEMKKESEKQQKTVLKSSQKEKAEFNKEGESNETGQDPSQNNKKQNKKENAKLNHPYKGKKIDYSG